MKVDNVVLKSVKGTENHQGEISMDEIFEKKQEIRQGITNSLGTLSNEERAEKTKGIENRVFEFANFLEAKVVLLYMASHNEVPTEGIFRKCFDYNKIVVLPAFETTKFKIKLFKIDNPEADMIIGPRHIPEPNPVRCKVVPMDCLDIALIPAVALDEKGGRIGTGEGYYDRFIPKLPITTRKVALAFEEQILSQIPMESHDKHVDIIITEKRIIYKI
jgi:5-formyltetrahydrofolate cyclo-ligase